MFKATIKAEMLQSALDSVSVLVDECKLQLSTGSLGIRAVDPANVGMVDLKLTPTAFEEYEVDGGKIGINLNRFEDVVGMAGSGDDVHLELDEETRTLNISFDGLSFTMSLIDPSSIRAEPDIPDLDLPVEVTVLGKQLDRGIKAADMVSDQITFLSDAEAEEFRIISEGDTDDVDLTLDEGDLISSTHADASSVFSLDYLKDIRKAIPSNAEVMMEVGDEFPVMMHFNFGENDEGQVTFMLAPRIQS